MPLYGKAGHYIEELFFSSHLEGWWVPEMVGRFDELKKVGINTAEGPCIISEQIEEP